MDRAYAAACHDDVVADVRPFTALRPLPQLAHKVAATPMRGWGGEVADRCVRFVFSNEPVERLALLGERVRAALAPA